MPAFGSFDYQSLMYQPMGAGIRTEFGTITPPGTRIAAYVRSTGGADFDDPNITNRLYSTLNAALSQCRSGKNDTVLVLPGHVENIASADQMTNLVAGTQIVGLGAGNSRPTFTWTTATSTFLLDVANVRLANLILNMDPGAGTVNVAAPITVSAAGCQIVGCKIRMGTSATSKVTIGITTTVAADDLLIQGCEIYGATAAECTTAVVFNGADRLQFLGNTASAATTATTSGVIFFSGTASTDIKFFGNYIRNNKALSTVAVTGMTANTGFVDDTVLSVLGDGAGDLTGAWATPAGVVFGPGTSVANNIGERAVPFGTASA